MRVQQQQVAGDFAAVCGNAKLKAAIEADMKRVAGEGKLRGFERVAAFIVEPEPFAVENGCLTPTFKCEAGWGCACLLDSHCCVRKQ